MFVKKLREGIIFLTLFIFFHFVYRYIEDGQFSNATGNDLAKLYSKQPGLIPVDDFTQADRERVLELLLSQERVVSLIYAKTFPINPSITHKGSNMDNNAQNANSSNGNGTGLVNEFNQLLDGSDLAFSPTNNGNNGGNDNRPSTTSALQPNGGNTVNNADVTATGNNSLTPVTRTNKAGGLTLPPVNQNRGISR
jgi:hypothetical protein